MKSSKDLSKFFISLILIIIIIFLGIVITINLNISKKTETLFSEKTEPGCFKGEKQEFINEKDKFKTTFLCLGRLDDNVIYDSLKINEEEILIRVGSKVYLFNLTSNEFTLLKDGIILDKYKNYGYNGPVIKLSSTEYLINLYTLFDSENHKFSIVTDKRLKESYEFIDSRPNYSIINTVYLKNRYIVYIAKQTIRKSNTSVSNLIIWLEDFANLNRTKIASFKNFPFKKHILPTVIKLDNDKILIVNNNELYYYNTNLAKMKFLKKIDNTEYNYKAFYINSEEVLLSTCSMQGFKAYILNITNNEIREIKDNPFFKEYTCYEDNNSYKLALINEKHILIYGLFAGTIDLGNEKINIIKNQLTKRLNFNLISLKNNKIFILGGYLLNNRPYSLPKQQTPINFNSAELFSYEILY